MLSFNHLLKEGFYREILSSNLDIYIYICRNGSGPLITSDFNFIDVDFYVEYRYSDSVKALYAFENPLEILLNISQSSIRTVISSYSVDDVLTTGKNEIQSTIREMILTRLEQQDIGIQLVNITMQDSEPPVCVQSCFIPVPIITINFICNFLN